MLVIFVISVFLLLLFGAYYLLAVAGLHLSLSPLCRFLSPRPVLAIVFSFYGHPLIYPSVIVLGTGLGRHIAHVGVILTIKTSSLSPNIRSLIGVLDIGVTLTVASYSYPLEITQARRPLSDNFSISGSREGQPRSG